MDNSENSIHFCLNRIYPRICFNIYVNIYETPFRNEFAHNKLILPLVIYLFILPPHCTHTRAIYTKLSSG